MDDQRSNTGIIKAIPSVLILVLFDQLTKFLADTYLNGQKAVAVIPDIFELTYVENRGAAFGIMQNFQLVFIIVTAVIVFGICLLYCRMPSTKRFFPAKCCLVFLIAGAAGNWIDRVKAGYVIDFFYFKPINFPVFNVADIYVTVSIILLALLILFYYKEEEFDQIMKG
ncbi:MAG: signal peptidase II [Lachnospiraceae bacterium]|nr:signal peptidase II [Lachnospiraceae bacterium]